MTDLIYRHGRVLDCSRCERPAKFELETLGGPMLLCGRCRVAREKLIESMHATRRALRGD